jgi:hypothetical protein
MSGMNVRDEFSEGVKRKLAGRTADRCSNPSCKRSTIGPSEAAKAVTNVGVAAHITAASEGGPRYNASLTQEQRSDIQNGIWLCQNCAKAVDDDSRTYTESLLREWKKQAEKSAHDALEKGLLPQPIPIDVRVLVHKAYIQNNSVQHFFIKIVNATHDAEVEVTHVWYENDMKTKDILTRPLPKRLKTSESWETWVPVSDIPENSENEDIFQHFRAVISTGEVFTSQNNVSVRPSGYVAG